MLLHFGVLWVLLVLLVGGPCSITSVGMVGQDVAEIYPESRIYPTVIFAKNGN